MKLTRRDALTALGTAGVASTAGCSSLFSDGETDTPASTETDTATPQDVSPMGTLLALAEVLYPSEVETSEEFIQTYLMGRIYDEDAYQTELETGVETLDRLAQESQGSQFGALSPENRVAVIEGTELRSGDSAEDGSDVERVNYYLIDELLFAFYASPVGGELVGNINPRGWPGGFGYSPELPQ